MLPYGDYELLLRPQVALGNAINRVLGGEYDVSDEAVRRREQHAHSAGELYFLFHYTSDPVLLRLKTNPSFSSLYTPVFVVIYILSLLPSSASPTTLSDLSLIHISPVAAVPQICQIDHTDCQLLVIEEIDRINKLKILGIVR